MNGLKLIDAEMNMVSSSGAVSPVIRATASMAPVMMPGNAVGMTTRRIVRYFGTPRAYADSRSSFGTSLSISSVERTMTGIIKMVSDSAPVNPVRSQPRVRIRPV